RRRGPRARQRDGDRGRLPFLGRSRGASPRRGRPEPRPLARRGQGPAALGVRRGWRRADAAVGRRPDRRRGARVRRGGQGRAAARPPGVRRHDLDTARGPRRVAERQRRRCAPPLRSAEATRLMADPTLYLFDGYNLLHAGGYEDARELRDTLASFVALKGARGVLVFDGHGPDQTLGP